MLAENIAHNVLDADASQDTFDARQSTSPNTIEIIIVGSGPVGMRCAEEVLKRMPLASIRLFGNEPARPYNRVQLTALLAGQVSREQIDLPMPGAEEHPNFKFEVATITQIDRTNRQIRDNLGRWHRYDKLILAMGARAHVPDIPGNARHGVYCFRNIADTEALFARITRSRHVVVLGGGLLGIEAASAFQRDGTRVTLVQQGSHLMNRQLDARSSALLEAELASRGIEVITQSGVREILGDDNVTGVKLFSGATMDCDTVVICAGILANKELARVARIQVGAGIQVNDQMQTSDPDIYAIGECCEHDGKTFGLVNPGFEQAAVLAQALLDSGARYRGSSTVTRLKVVGESVYSMGKVVELDKHPKQRVLIHQDTQRKQYRKLVFLKGKLIGALAYGDWSESARVTALFQSQGHVWPWQRLRFRFNGTLWTESQSVDVRNWPADTVVCQCKQVSRGQISEAIDSGDSTLEAVRIRSGASSVCGSCVPLVSQMLDTEEPLPGETAWTSMLAASVIALLVVMFFLMSPPATVANSVQSVGWFERFWNDGFWKQVSGFSLLGLSALGLIMSLRKRLDFQWMGKFAYWRLVHVGLGTLCAGILILHTGFNTGSNLNQILLIDFVLLLILGSSAGLMVALGHVMSAGTAGKMRRFWTWSHILISWPLPALLIAHIVSVYYF